MTIDSRGRSMKIEDSICGALPGRRRHGRLARVDHHAGPDLLQALGDYTLAQLEPVSDDIGTVALVADGDPLHLDLVVDVDLQHVAPGLVDLYRLLRDQQRTFRLGGLD